MRGIQNIWCRVILLSGLTFVFLPETHAQYHIVKDNIACLYGLKDSTGNWKVEPKYEVIELLPDKNVFKVKSGENWGVINSSGNVVIPIKYYWLYYDRQNYYYANVYKEGEVLCGVLSKKGKILIEPVYNSVKSTYDGFFIIQSGNYFGYADTNGFVFKPLFASLDFLSQHWIKVSDYYEKDKNIGYHLYGLMNLKEKTISAIKYDDIYQMPKGFLFRQKDRYTYLGNEGDTIFKEGTRLRTYFEGHQLHFASEMFAFSYGKKWGLADAGGNIIADTAYDDINILDADRWMLKRYHWKFTLDGKKGLMDIKGTVLIPAIYDELQMINSKSRMFTQNKQTEDWIKAVKDGKIGLLNPAGEEVLPFRFNYESYYYFSNENEVWYFDNLPEKSENPFEEKALVPHIEQLDLFVQLDKKNYIFKHRNSFIFMRKTGDSLKQGFAPVNTYYNKVYRKLDYIEVLYNGKTYQFDSTGRPYADPFAGKEIVHELANSVIFRDSNEYFGLADRKGNSIVDTVYKEMRYYGYSIWFKVNNDPCRLKPDPYYSTNQCPCNWIRVDASGKRMDNRIYDLPVVDNYEQAEEPATEIVYLNNKAGLYDFNREKFLIQPVYDNIVDMYSENIYLLAAVEGDSLFTIYTSEGKLVSSKKWSGYIPLPINNLVWETRLHKAGYSDNLVLLTNKKEELLVDVNGKIVGSSFKKSELLEASYMFYNNAEDGYSAQLRGPYIYMPSSFENIHAQKWMKYLWNEFFTTRKDYFTGFPSGLYYDQECGAEIYLNEGKSTQVSFFNIQFLNENYFSVETPFHRDTNFHYLLIMNYCTKGKDVFSVTIDSLFAPGTDINKVLNDFIIEDIRSRNDLDLDCNNPESFYLQSGGRWCFEKEGLHIFIGSAYVKNSFESVIPWQKLLPYANKNGIIKSFLE